MSSSTEITQPAPILVVNNYPSVPTITTISTISSPTLQYDISSTTTSMIPNIEQGQEYAILSFNNKIMYYYQEPSIKAESEYSPLFNQFKKPIWKLTNRDWHGMTLIYQHLIIVLSTTPPQFRFSLNNKFYHWQIEHSTSSQQQLFTLKCYETETKNLISQLNDEKIMLDILPVVAMATNDNTNPFRKSNSNHGSEDDPFTTLVILSGLLINHHIKILLKSLGGGPEALQMIIDPTAAIQHNEGIYDKNTALQKQEDDDEEEEEDEIASLSSTYPRHYPGHRSLVDDGGLRWSSSAQSFKSIELDPGVWHCWWGYSFWWSWFPCCMPGGCCDRALIRIKGGHRKHKVSRSNHTRTLSKQGWQQQYY